MLIRHDAFHLLAQFSICASIFSLIGLIISYNAFTWKVQQIRIETELYSAKYQAGKLKIK